MKLGKIGLALATLGFFSQTTLADQLTDNHGKFLINAQMHQMANSSNVKSIDANLGYFDFDGNGTVKYYRLDYAPSSSTYNTIISAKHINTTIQDYHGNGLHDLTQNCESSDMGRMRRSTTTTRISYGNYTFNNNELQVTVDGRTTVWHAIADGNTTRWQIVSTSDSDTTITNQLGFGYFADGLGSYPLDFKQSFNQGTSRSSTTGYWGGFYSNSGAQSADTFPSYSQEFKFHKRHHSNLDKNNNPQTNTYSNIWFYDLSNPSQLAEARNQSPGFDESKGLYVQSTLTTNYYVHLPTLVYENTGHMFQNFPKNPYAAETQQAFDTRKCWTESDTARTHGHQLTHLGVWNGGKVTAVVSIEMGQNGSYPYLSIAHGRWQD